MFAAKGSTSAAKFAATAKRYAKAAPGIRTMRSSLARARRPRLHILIDEASSNACKRRTRRAPNILDSGATGALARRIPNYAAFS